MIRADRVLLPDRGLADAGAFAVGVWPGCRRSGSIGTVAVMSDDGSDDPGAHGESHAMVYDQIYADAFRTTDAVRFLANATKGGPLLDLGVGTGRLAIPLAAAAVDVHGLDASPAMLAELRSRQGGDKIAVFEADVIAFTLAERDQVTCAR